MLILTALLGVAFGADCAAPTTPTDMTAHIDDAMLAFATLDEEGVYTAADQATYDLECMGALLTKESAAAYHRLVGLRAFMQGNSDDALVAFQAARALEPGYRLSTKIAPEGGKLARLWESAGSPPDDAATVTFRTPSGASSYVDGAQGNQYSLEFPAVVQYVDWRNRVLWTGYVRPGEKPPKDIPSADEVASTPAPAPQPAPAPRPAPAPQPEVAEVEEADEVLLDGPELGEEYGDLGQFEDMDALDESDETAEALLEPEEPDETESIVMLDEPEPEPEPDSRRGNRDDEPLPMDLEPTREPKASRERKGLHPVWAATIGTGVASAAAFGASAGLRASFDADPTATKFHLTNGTFYGSMGLAAATVGLAITGFVVEF